MHRKNIEEIGVGPEEALLAEHLLPVAQHREAEIVDPHGGDHLRIFLHQGSGHRCGAGSPVKFVGADDPVQPHPVDALGLLVEAVVAQFVAHVEQDQDAAGQTDCQPDDVDEGIPLLAPHIAQGDFQVTAKHKIPLCVCFRSTSFSKTVSQDTG